MTAAPAPELAAVADKPETVPVLVDGVLRLLAGPRIREGTLVPPTFTGWQQFLALAPTSAEKFTELRKAGELWWARKIPQTLLSAAREEDGEDRQKSPPTNAPAGAELVQLNDGRWISADEARQRYEREKQALRAGQALDPTGNYGVEPITHAAPPTTPEPGLTTPLMRPGKNTSSPLSRSVRLANSCVRVAPKRSVLAMVGLTICLNSAVT